MYAQAADAYNSGHTQTALHWIERCLRVAPDHADVLHLRGVLALALGDAGDAERWLIKAVERSTNPAFHNTLSVVQTKLRAFDRAAATASSGLEHAQRWQPKVDQTVLLYNLGRALQLGSRFEEAAAAYRQLLALDPGHAHAHNNLGGVLNKLGAFDDALSHFSHATTLQPGNLEARSNLGHALLAAGRYREAWPHFEHRWSNFQDETGRPEGAPPDLPIPQWKGEPVRAERDRLLILNEQGLGDSLQFARYIPLTLARFAKVGFAGPGSLRELFVESFGRGSTEFEYLDAGRIDLRDWDVHSPLMSLPMAFDTSIDTVPADMPYLRADPRAAHRWSTRLAKLGDAALPRIGIAWAGGRFRPEVDALRSMPVELMDALVSWPQAHWISLQKPVDEAKSLLPRQRAHVIDWMDEVTDFADTAALVASLDLVICVDTSVAHLAGAMGKQVWLLNRYHGCWRWMRDREDTPWYPRMRLFNQNEPGNWNEVLGRVRAVLEGGAWRPA
ncbi:TPR repeat-containing protein [Caballeronia hypogeia]|uniref:TPR repeat-containing protein n=1 Tax=Caballeronia hypogeia TaxID=1777140 RepID=A0A157ZH16_9BURK|nr:tetratricopeptide repeat-containing glycosyltransferase family protein [Caballeronia hypogeia]SAK44739.1 TPR repeat-containing protein [Caballeronia hypogeia]